jgi:hypothetical protein
MFPVGYLGVPSGRPGVTAIQIMTDHGPQDSDGRSFDPDTYPELFKALQYKYGRDGDFFKIPDMRNRVPNPTHTHTYVPTTYSDEFGNVSMGLDVSKNGSDYAVIATRDPWTGLTRVDPVPPWSSRRGDVIGNFEAVKESPSGLNVSIKFNNEAFTKAVEACKGSLITADEALSILGSKTPTTFTKENTAVTTRLKTPAKNIKRRDLTVAMRLMGYHNQDDLYNAIAIVQETADNETIFRAQEYEKFPMVGKYVRVPGTDIAGMCSDVVRKPNSLDLDVVVAGKLHHLAHNAFIVVRNNEAAQDDLDAVWDSAHKD